MNLQGVKTGVHLELWEEVPVVKRDKKGKDLPSSQQINDNIYPIEYITRLYVDSFVKINGEEIY